MGSLNSIIAGLRSGKNIRDYDEEVKQLLLEEAARQKAAEKAKAEQVAAARAAAANKIKNEVAVRDAAYQNYVDSNQGITIPSKPITNSPVPPFDPTSSFGDVVANIANSTTGYDPNRYIDPANPFPTPKPVVPNTGVASLPSAPRKSLMDRFDDYVALTTDDGTIAGYISKQGKEAILAGGRYSPRNAIEQNAIDRYRALSGTGIGWSSELAKEQLARHKERITALSEGKLPVVLKDEQNKSRVGRTVAGPPSPGDNSVHNKTHNSGSATESNLYVPLLNDNGVVMGEVTPEARKALSSGMPYTAKDYTEKRAFMNYYASNRGFVPLLVSEKQDDETGVLAGYISQEGRNAILSGENYKPRDNIEADTIQRFNNLKKGYVELLSDNQWIGFISQDGMAALYSGAPYVPKDKTEQQTIKKAVEVAKAKAIREAASKNIRTPEQNVKSDLSSFAYLAEKTGAGAVSGVENFVDIANSAFQTALGGIFSLGTVANNPVSNWFFDNARGVLTKKNLGEKWNESIEQRYDVPDWVRKWTGDTMYAAGNLALPIIAEKLTLGVSPWLEYEIAKMGAASAVGTISKAAQASKATGALMKSVLSPSSVLFMTSAAGNAAKQAYRETGELGKSLTYGVPIGILEGATEKLFGGYGGTGIGAGLIDFNIKNKVLKKAVDLLSEGVEEMLMTAVEPILKRSILNQVTDNPSVRDYLESGLSGVLLSGVMNVATYPVRKHGRVKTATALNNSVTQMAEFIPEATALQPLDVNTATEEQIERRQAEVRELVRDFGEMQDDALFDARDRLVEAIKEVEKARVSDNDIVGARSTEERKQLVDARAIQNDFVSDLKLQLRDIDSVLNGRPTSADVATRYINNNRKFTPTHVDLATGLPVNVVGNDNGGFVVTDAYGVRFVKSPDLMGLRYREMTAQEASEIQNRIMQAQAQQTQETQPAQVQVTQATPPVQEQEAQAVPSVQEQEAQAVPPVQEQEAEAVPPVQEQEAQAVPPVQEQEAQAVPPVEVTTSVSPDLRGSNTVAYTPSNTRVNLHYEIVPLSRLVFSHNSNGGANPNYPAELQPRDRSRAASSEQIMNIGEHLNPVRLAESAVTTDGAPIVGPDYVVESGNGRMAAIDYSIRHNLPSFEAYHNYLVDNKERFGITGDVPPDGVLVRVRDTDLDRRSFVLESNVQTVAGRSATESANIDASIFDDTLLSMFQPSADGSINFHNNQDFVDLFLERMPLSERNDFVAADGSLSKAGSVRLRNAIMYSAYENNQLQNAATEALRDDFANISAALGNAAPAIIKFKNALARGDVFDLDISADISAAYDGYVEARNTDVPVEWYVRQERLDNNLTPVSKALVEIFYELRRSPRKLSSFILNYYKNADSIGSPKQLSLFENREITTVQLFNDSVRDTFGADPDMRTVSVQNEMENPPAVTSNNNVIIADVASNNSETAPTPVTNNVIGADILDDDLLALFDYAPFFGFNLSRNKEFVDAFLQRLPDSERGSFVSDGKFDIDRGEPIRDAVLYATFGENDFLGTSAFLSSTSVERAARKLANVAPRILQHKRALAHSGMAHLDISDDILAAYDALAFKDNNTTGLTPVAQKLASLLKDNQTLSNKVDKLIFAYYDAAMKVAPEAEVTPVQLFDSVFRDSFKPSDRVSSYKVDRRIALGMSEEQRYEILKDKILTVAPYDKKRFDILSNADLEGLKNVGKGPAKKILRKIGEQFGVFKNYSNNDVELDFEFSRRNLDESAQKQKSRYDDFVKMLSSFDRVINNAIGIKVEEDQYIGTPRASENLERVYILVSAFNDNIGLVPVRLIVKEFSDTSNKLYMAVSLTKKEDGFITSANTSLNAPSDTPHASSISLPQLFANVNTQDGDFLRYIPDGFLNQEQLESKARALQKNDARLEGMRSSGQRTVQQVSQPQTAQQQGPQTQGAQPQATQPQATQPQATQPQATQPQATQPQATQLQATQPQATQPQATQPQATQPQATQLQATQPQRASTGNQAYRPSENNSSRWAHPEVWENNGLNDGNNEPLVSLGEIVRGLSRDLSTPISVGNIRENGSLGIFKPREGAIRTRVANDLPVISHEVGHTLDKRFNLSALPSITEAIKALDSTFADNYRPNELPSEAVAEFVRTYFNSFAVARQRYPNFFNDFRNAVDADLLAKLDKRANQFNAILSSDLEQQAANAIVSRTDKQGKIDMHTASEAMHKAYTNITDEFHPINRFVAAAEKRLNKRLDGAENPYVLAVNSYKTNVIINHVMTQRLLDSNGNEVGRGLAEIVDAIGPKEWDDFGLYLVCRHGVSWKAPDENGNVKRIFANDLADTPEQMTAIVQRMEREHPHFIAVADELDQFQQSLFKHWLVDTGLVSQDQMNNLLAKYPHYVPLYRNVEEVYKGISVSGNISNQKAPIKRAKGSGLDVYHPVENIMLNIAKYVKAGKQNLTMQTMVNTARLAGGMAEFIEEVPPDYIPQTFRTNSIKDGLMEAFSDRTDFDDITRIIDDTVDDTLMSFSPFADPNKKIVTVMMDGKPRYMQIHDVPLYEALEGVGKIEALGFITTLAARTTRAFSALTTSLDPTFGLASNSFRDIATAITNTKNPSVISYLGDYFTAFYDQIVKSDAFLEYMSVGGGNSAPFNPDGKTINKLLKEIGVKDKTIRDRFLNALLFPVRFVGAANDFIETAPRLAEFKSSRRLGNDMAQALYDSQDITTNFSKHGKKSRGATAFFAFSNAAIQGNDKTFRTVGGAPARTFRRIALLALPSVILWLLNHRSPEDEKEINQLSNHNKNNFFNLHIGNGKFIAIPKGREYGVVGTLIERVLDATIGKMPFDKVRLGLASYLASAFLPPMIDSPEAILSNTTGVGTIFEIGANKDFAGRPIVPGNLQNFENKDQFDETTSWFARWFGNVTGQSPKVIDHIINSNTGILGRLNRSLTAEKKDLTFGVKNRFVKDNRYSQDILNVFYDSLEKATKAKNSDPENVEKKAKYDALNGASGAVSEINKLIRATPDLEQKRDYRQVVLELVGRVAETTSYNAVWQNELDRRIKVFRNLITSIGDKHSEENINLLYEYVDSNFGKDTFKEVGAVEKELLRLYHASDKDSVMGYDIPKNTITYKDKETVLGTSEYLDTIARINELSAEKTAEVIGSDEYKQATAEEQVDMINKANRYAVNTVKNSLFEPTEIKDYRDKMELRRETPGVSSYDKARLSALSGVMEFSGDKDSAAGLYDYALDLPSGGVYDELSRLHSASGSSIVVNGSYSTLFDYTKNKVKYVVQAPPQDIPQLIREADKRVYEAFANEVSSKGWGDLSDTTRLERLSKIKSSVREKFEIELRNKYGTKAVDN